jgi:hypothetical protein
MNSKQWIFHQSFFHYMPLCPSLLLEAILYCFKSILSGLEEFSDKGGYHCYHVQL